MRNIISSPGVMLDVGANLGQTVDLWNKEFPGAEIHSFEPVKRLFDQLFLNFSGVARCNNVGVGNKSETMRINYGAHDVSHSFIHAGADQGGEEVQVITLDQYCEAQCINHIDVIKIDVEGFEYEVIRGANKIFSEQRVDLVSVELGVDSDGYYVFYPDFAKVMEEMSYYTVGFYDQTCWWNGDARLLFCNVLFARRGLKISGSLS